VHSVSFPKPYADAVAKLRVPCGFVLIATFLLLSDPTINSLFVGLPISLAGLALRAWAAGHLEKNAILTDSGPYAWVRNPLYLGTLTAAAGFVVASRRWELAVLCAAVFLLIYLPVVELEEEYLAKLFAEFPEYALRVNKLVPGLPGKRAAKTFRFKLYRHNREYEAGLAFLAGVGFLLWKAVS
jgi:protein-S-isoprenylcysteine O-methyltransferase Ste14